MEESKKIRDWKDSGKLQDFLKNMTANDGEKRKQKYLEWVLLKSLLNLKKEKKSGISQPSLLLNRVEPFFAGILALGKVYFKSSLLTVADCRLRCLYWASLRRHVGTAWRLSYRTLPGHWATGHSLETELQDTGLLSTREWGVKWWSDDSQW